MEEGDSTELWQVAMMEEWPGCQGNIMKEASLRHMKTKLDSSFDGESLEGFDLYFTYWLEIEWFKKRRQALKQGVYSDIAVIQIKEDG